MSPNGTLLNDKFFMARSVEKEAVLSFVFKTTFPLKEPFASSVLFAIILGIVLKSIIPVLYCFQLFLTVSLVQMILKLFLKELVRFFLDLLSKWILVHALVQHC